MKRVIVDYVKLTNEILNLLVEKFPDGYEEHHIIRFKNAKNELIEAVEVRTTDTIYLVKVSTKLSDRIVNYDEDEEMDIVPIANIELDDDDAIAEDDDEDENLDKPEFDDEDDEDADKVDFIDEDEDDEDDKD